MVVILDCRPNVVIDTSSLMEDDSVIDRALEKYDNVIIHIVTVEELDNLKVNRDIVKAGKARRALKKIWSFGNKIKYELNKIIIDGLSGNELDLYNPNDDIILSSAYLNNADICTDDFALRIKAKFVGVPCADLYYSESDYRGYIEVNLDEETMSKLYSDTSFNLFDCYINEYLVVNDENGNNVDILKWNGEKYSNLYNKNIKTLAFGDKIKPKDVYQRAVIDSIMSNTITAISGSAGTGKSLLSLMCAMYLVESGKYSRIVILNNPTKAKGATDCGYYTGSMIEKLMQNSIGNILNTKFGDRYAVDLLLQQDKIRVISMADARGMEIRDDEILYITECQNTSIELLKLSLSRVSQNAKVIIEGDICTQVDSMDFYGNRNGMRRAIEIFKGNDIFGYIELKNVWRSKIAEIVEKM